MNKVSRGSYPAEKINQIGTDYNSYIDQLYLTYTLRVQAQGCVPDLAKMPYVSTNYTL
jgi:hypothetical protein